MIGRSVVNLIEKLENLRPPSKLLKKPEITRQGYSGFFNDYQPTGKAKIQKFVSKGDRKWKS